MTEMTTAFITGLGTSTVSQVSTILAAVVGAVILVWGALVGLGFIKKYISKWIGKRA